MQNQEKLKKKLINSKDEKQSFMDKLAGVPGLGWLGKMLGGESPDKEEDDKKKKKEETFDLTRFSSILSMRGQILVLLKRDIILSQILLEMLPQHRLS